MQNIRSHKVLRPENLNIIQVKMVSSQQESAGWFHVRLSLVTLLSQLTTHCFSNLCNTNDDIREEGETPPLQHLHLNWSIGNN